MNASKSALRYYEHPELIFGMLISQCETAGQAPRLLDHREMRACQSASRSDTSSGSAQPCCTGPFIVNSRDISNPHRGLPPLTLSILTLFVVPRESSPAFFQLLRIVYTAQSILASSRSALEILLYTRSSKFLRILH